MTYMYRTLMVVIVACGILAVACAPAVPTPAAPPTEIPAAPTSVPVATELPAPTIQPPTATLPAPTTAPTETSMPSATTAATATEASDTATPAAPAETATSATTSGESPTAASGSTNPNLAFMPPGEGQTILLNNCSNCHSFICAVIGQRSKEHLESVKATHRERVSNLTDQELDTLFTYLYENFGDQKPAPVLPAVFEGQGCTAQ